jgi:DNA invertase Pin-like site-specific DNA recombinase
MYGNMAQRTAALYLSVSTDDQTVENQRQALTEACERRGWRVVAEFCDEGISGANGRDKRPGFDTLHKAITRHQFDIVAAWSVDRLGRSLQDLVGFLGEVQAAGVDLYLDRQVASTRARRPATRSSRCSACSPSSNARSPSGIAPR